MMTRTSKTIIFSLLIGINHGIIVTICLYLIIYGKFSFEERAIYVMSAVLFWMGAQRIIKKLLPGDSNKNPIKSISFDLYIHEKYIKFNN